MPLHPNTDRSKNFSKFLGRVMRQQRRRAQIKAQALAYDLNITPQAVSNWETGKVTPTLSLLLQFADVVRCPAWRLIALAERAYRLDKTFKESMAHVATTTNLD